MLTWIHPLHPVRESVIGTDAQSARVVELVLRAIGMEIVASPAWVCDDGVGGGEGEEREQAVCARGKMGEHRGRCPRRCVGCLGEEE